MKSTIKNRCKICHSSSLSVIEEGLFDDRYGAPGKHNVIQCGSCGYGYTRPGIQKSRIGQFYAKYYPHGGANPKDIKKNPKITGKMLSFILGLGHTCHWYTKTNQQVLDIGCGSGRSLVEIKYLGGNPYGVEPDPSVQKIAKKLNLHVHNGFITDNPYPKLKFDLITASQVIEHEPDPISFLKSAAKKLDKHGEIILSTPNLNSLGRKTYKNKWLNWHIPYHMSFYTIETFKQLAAISGLSIVRSKTVTPTLWTVLQWELLKSQPQEGAPTSNWGKRSEKRYLSYIKKILLYIIAIPYSRIIDFLGIGESLVVVLKKMTKPNIFVLTACHNEKEKILTLLGSLATQTYKNLQVVVVDDGSIDGTDIAVKSKFPQVKIIKGNGDLWWTGSIAKGIDWITRVEKTKNSYVVIINADCVVTPSFISTLVGSAISLPNTLIGSMIIDQYSGKLIDGAVKIDWSTGKFRQVLSSSSSRYIQSEFLTTKGVIYPITIFKEIGNFAVDILPHYLSDYEFSNRACKHGYKLLVDRRSIVFNDSLRTGIGRLEKNDLRHRLRILFSRKSKLNVIDHFHFIRLCAPRRYKFKSYLIILAKIIYVLSGLRNK